MADWSWLVGDPKASLRGLEGVQEAGQEYMDRILSQASRPGPRELATGQAYRQAQAEERSRAAGAGGQDAAVIAARQARMAPLMAARQAEAEGAARAADVEAQQAAQRQAIEQQQQIEALLVQLREAQRGKGALAGLTDIGTKVAGAYL